MKKFISLFVVLAMAVSLMTVTTASAASAKVSYSGGSSEVLAGKTYTIKYTVKFSSCGVGTFKVSAGGAFEKVSGGDPDMHDSTPNNSTKSFSGSITVKVKSNAKAGDKGTVKISGEYLSFDSDYNPSAPKSYSKTYSSTVVTKLTATPKPTTKSSSSSTSSKATATPEPSPTPTETPEPTPTATPEPSEWQLVSSRLDTLEKGGAVSLTVSQNSQIPLDTLRALKEKQGVLEVDFGTYFCKIDGAGLRSLPAGTEGLDLSVSMVKNTALSSAAGGADAYQLHFAHTGPLPGRFAYSFPATEHVPGQTLYLYYYYADSGVVEGKQAAEVDINGNVTFDIYHCSSYFVTEALIEDAAGVLAAPQDPDETNALIDEAVQTALLQAKAALPASVSLPALFAALAGSLLLGIFITLLICRSGPFKKQGGKHADL